MSIRAQWKIWFSEHRPWQWIFSGIGVFLVSTIGYWLLSTPPNPIKTKTNFSNQFMIQDGNISVNTKSKINSLIVARDINIDHSAKIIIDSLMSERNKHTISENYDVNNKSKVSLDELMRILDKRYKDIIKFLKELKKEGNDLIINQDINRLTKLHYDHINSLKNSQFILAREIDSEIQNIIRSRRYEKYELDYVIKIDSFSQEKINEMFNEILKVLNITKQKVN